MDRTPKHPEGLVSGRREVRPPRTLWGRRLGRRRLGSGGDDGGGGGHRPYGPPPSLLSKFASPVLIALVMAAGAFLGIKLSRSSGIAEQPPKPPSEVIVKDGHRYLWRKVQPAAPGKVYWGAFRLGAPYRTGLVSSLEEEVGAPPAVIMWYQEWAGQPDFPVKEADWLFDRGIVPMLTWEPWKPPDVFGTVVNDQPRFSLKRIVDGKWDGYLTRYAKEIARYGGPVMLRPMHEMDGFWYPWSGSAQVSEGNSPLEYIRAWRHMWRIFRDAGASNVTWVWSVNHLSVPDTADNQIRNYWPGKRYVDWVGVSGFNWGTANPRTVWKGFEAVEGPRYRELLAYGRPIAITEMGAPEVGGNKARWIRDAFRDIHSRFPKLRMVIWYDKQDTPEREWQIDSSPQSLEAFQRAVDHPKVLSADAALATAEPHVPR
jgi:hypothetical protein